MTRLEKAKELIPELEEIFMMYCPWEVLSNVSPCAAKCKSALETTTATASDCKTCWNKEYKE
jgi:hypothetical protein